MKKQPKVKKNNNKKFSVKPLALAVIVPLLFFIAGFATFAVYGKSQEGRAYSTAETFVDLIIEGKSDEAYALTSKEFKETQTQEEFIAVVEALESQDPTKPAEPVFFVEDNEARYIQYINGVESIGGSGTFNVVLVKDGRDWKVQSLNVD